MNAGRELDALVAEKVMGFRHHPAMPGYDEMWFMSDGGSIDLPNYSTDIAAAWQVVEKLRLGIAPMGDGKWGVAMRDQPVNSIKDLTINESAPLAICLAALKARGFANEI